MDLRILRRKQSGAGDDRPRYDPARPREPSQVRSRASPLRVRLRRAIAKSMNTELRRRESLWAPGSYDHVALEDDEAVLSAIVYTLMNPVAAGLVRSGHQWPGLRGCFARVTVNRTRIGCFCFPPSIVPGSVVSGCFRLQADLVLP